MGIVASESRLVGVDIVDSGTRMNGVHAASQYITIFRDQLHPNECQFIINQPSETCRYTVFFIIWALKESFIKAIGIGLGFPLHQIEFNITFTDTPEQFHTTQIEQNTRNIEEMNVEKAHTHSFSLCANTNKLTGTATAIIQGHQRPDWKFSFFNLDDRYIIAIAYGPFFDALPSYQIDAWGSLLPNPNPKFALKIPNVIVGNDVIYDSTDDSFERSNDDVSVMDRAASCFNCICSCAARYLCCRKVKSSTGNSGTGNSSSSSSSNNSGRAHVYGSIPTVDPDDSSADTSHFEHIHSNTSTDITDMSSANRLTSGPVANNSEVITYKDILKEINIENLLCLEDLIRYQELFPTSTV